MDKDLSIKKLKNIAKDIIENELNEYGIDADVLPITFIEYRNNIVSKERYIICKIFKYVHGKLVGGFYDHSSNSVFIFIDRIKKIKKIDKQIFKLAFICYHEVRHRQQREFSFYSYEGFINGINHLDPINYYLSHDYYAFEIGANIYGIRKAEEYLKKNYPDIYEKQKEEILFLSKLYYLEFLTYDSPQFFDNSFKVLRMVNKFKNNSNNNLNNKLL